MQPTPISIPGNGRSLSGEILRSREISARPGFVIGVALAGFFDGIVLHQILQWHHMICIEAHCVVKTVETLQRQVFTDGLFHAAMLLVLVGGLCLLVRESAADARMSSRRFWGAALMGAGIFNVIEGIIDHHLLQIHHVRFGPGQAIWDVSFLILSGLLAAVGCVVFRRPSAGRTNGRSTAL